MNILKPALVLLSLSNLVAAMPTGLYLGATGHHSSSDVEHTVTESDAVETIVRGHAGLKGFGLGFNTGYRYILKDKYIMGIDFAVLKANADYIGTNTDVDTGNGTSTEQSKLTLELNYALYPMASIGYLSSDKTAISFKAGYGLENWKTAYTKATTPYLTEPDNHIKGPVVAAEVLTQVKDKVYLSLSSSLSFLDKTVTSTDTETSSCTLCIKPETFSSALSLQYVPKG
ncbi:hypothetical protein [Candidatus Synchoanobacter obligatus]|uniref:Outer membrane protein beta-barrel domain-containing protein n=1 Tax=Candidatus Synchoanobacter obligatus TaxID=2919597 RepID=A0ABT1L4R7_9GAMM|nr:hypothetical protein [Candidatus Synchoanobacter obligatus]MCP8351720.1 hypothetical protein [Candidatus Synchoanobacter obligatus]